MSIATQQSFPAQRSDPAPGEVADLADFHDHAWREVEDLDQPLLLGMYRCDLCDVVWAL